ncbi:MAG: DHH family phosphoesterase [Clostridia bacterium]|nr:DHH family phosphoesterase [Clostridia bacterium]
MEQGERICALRGAFSGEAGRIAVTGHDAPDVDSVISCAMMCALLSHLGIAAQAVLPTRADAQARRVLPRFGIDPDAMQGELKESDALVLVDHHRGAHPGRVVAVIDHHPTMSPPQAAYVQIEQAGACAAIIRRLMREAGQPDMERWEALTAVALYLDTLALRSPKILPEEAAWAARKAERFGLDTALLTREGLGLRDMSAPARELALMGQKTYDFPGGRVISTYVQTDEMTQEKLEQILDAVRAELARSGVALWVFLHHDPVALRSAEFDLTPDGAMKVIRYDGLVSRGKDVMPRVEREMSGRREER